MFDVLEFFLIAHPFLSEKNPVFYPRLASSAVSFRAGQQIVTIKPGTVVHICNLRIWEAEAGGS
jgi:hypothetical protein